MSNMSTIAGLVLLHMRLMKDWHHLALPSGRYPSNCDELREAYPGIESSFDISERVSQFTGRAAVMVRLRERAA